MKEAYIFDYVNENEFRKLERSIKKYNMLAYKKLYFEYYQSLKEGNFLGNLINEDANTQSYELKLPTDAMFSKVHGDIKLHYHVYQKTTHPHMHSHQSSKQTFLVYGEHV